MELEKKITKNLSSILAGKSIKGFMTQKQASVYTEPIQASFKKIEAVGRELHSVARATLALEGDDDRRQENTKKTFGDDRMFQAKAVWKFELDGFELSGSKIAWCPGTDINKLDKDKKCFVRFLKTEPTPFTGGKPGWAIQVGQTADQFK